MNDNKIMNILNAPEDSDHDNVQNSGEKHYLIKFDFR